MIGDSEPWAAQQKEGIMSDRLLTDKELKRLESKYHSWQLPRAVTEAQDAKTRAIDEVEIRQATLKEVGEWLNHGLIAERYSVSSTRAIVLADRDLEALLRGEMPEEKP